MNVHPTVVVECPACRGSGSRVDRINRGVQAISSCPVCHNGKVECRIWTPEIEEEHRLRSCEHINGHELPKPWKVSRDGQRAGLHGRVRVVPVGPRWKVEYRPFVEDRELWESHRAKNGRTFYSRSLDTALKTGTKVFDKLCTKFERDRRALAAFVKEHALELQKHKHPSKFHQEKNLHQYALWMLDNKGGPQGYKGEAWLSRVRTNVERALGKSLAA